jgi:hypothetical protein
VPGAPPQQQQQVTPGGSEPAPGPRPGAAAAVAGDGKTPYRTSAPVMAEAKTPATAGPASGWQVMYGDESTAPGEPGAAEGEVCPQGLNCCWAAADEVCRLLRLAKRELH